MHGATVKIMEAQQSKLCNNYKNTNATLPGDGFLNRNM